MSDKLEFYGEQPAELKSPIPQLSKEQTEALMDKLENERIKAFVDHLPGDRIAGVIELLRKRIEG